MEQFARNVLKTSSQWLMESVAAREDTIAFSMIKLMNVNVKMATLEQWMGVEIFMIMSDMIAELLIKQLN